MTEHISITILVIATDIELVRKPYTIQSNEQRAKLINIVADRSLVVFEV